ncbi:hypothetical protein SDC9_179780 [bioreactor metagenome]|uniref:Uncharacterized protein n=1 Tax=bioreactor metagenome TaxID=1076179 RepID=A0A645H1S4_9ZZZZ
MEQVFARPLRHALYVVGARGIPLLLVLDQILLKIGHGKALADANPEIARGFKLRDFRAADFALAQGFERAVRIHGVDAAGGGAAGQYQCACQQQGG